MKIQTLSSSEIPQHMLKLGKGDYGYEYEFRTIEDSDKKIYWKDGAVYAEPECRGEPIVKNVRINWV